MSFGDRTRSMGVDAKNQVIGFCRGCSRAFVISVSDCNITSDAHHAYVHANQIL